MHIVEQGHDDIGGREVEIFNGFPAPLDDKGTNEQAPFQDQIVVSGPGRQFMSKPVFTALFRSSVSTLAERPDTS